jgi:hypothetical protein
MNLLCCRIVPTPAEEFAESRTASSDEPLFKAAVTYIPPHGKPELAGPGKWWTMITFGTNHAVCDGEAFFRFTKVWADYTSTGDFKGRFARVSNQLIFPKPEDHKGVSDEEAWKLGQVVGGLTGSPTFERCYHCKVFTTEQIAGLKASVS